MVKILIVLGTRPEAIKLAPVIHTLRDCSNVVICVTAQHRQMLDQVLDLFDIVPHHDLDIMQPGQDLFDITSKALVGIKRVLMIEEPDLVIMHGDTTTSMVAAMAAFYLNIPVAHVEAGLRTNDLRSPFPEEFNRQISSKLASFHFAPTAIARQNLLDEKVPSSQIFVTGNTVIDALFSVLPLAKKTNFPIELLEKIPFLEYDSHMLPKIILVTGHRRENFGSGFEEICFALRQISEENKNVQIIYPVHLNPNVRDPVNRILSNLDNVHLIEPLEYLTFVKLMDLSYFILTDSGGIQEEGPSLGKPVLVMRDTTERPEALEAGTVKLAGADHGKIVRLASELLTDDLVYTQMSKAHNPFGDGNSSKLIRDILIKRNVI